MSSENFKDFLNLFWKVSRHYWSLLPEFEEHLTIIRVAMSEILKSHDRMNIFLDSFWLVLCSILTLSLQKLDRKIRVYLSSE
jgi:hypothetical protein